MTDHQLPEDIAHWPSDPYRLLDVTSTTDERGLKQAYVALIRKYKPEHHPRQFALIRAAFEHVQTHLHWLQQLHEQIRESESDHEVVTKSDPNEDPQPLTTHSADFPSTQPSAESQVDDDPHRIDGEWDRHSDDQDEVDDVYSERAKSLVLAIDAAWQVAVNGDPASGYHTLRSLSERQWVQSDVFLRLYWLQRLFPQIESARHSCYWLIVALHHTQLKGPAWDLYCSELELHPLQLSVSDHESLLAVAPTADRLFDLLKVSWRAAAKHDRWSLIFSDLELIPSWIKESAREVWASILVQALDLASWSYPATQRIVDQCTRDLEDLTDLHFRLSNLFDRCDWLAAMRKEKPLDRIVQVTDEFIQLVRDMWCEAPDDLHPQLQAEFAKWAAHPNTALLMLTEIRKSANLAFQHLFTIIRHWKLNATEHRTAAQAESVERSVRQFLLAHHKFPYREVRGELLAFCIANGIELSEILPHARDIKVSGWPKEMYDKLQDDRPLEIIIHGVLLFWS